jgi:hypothetical protein
VNLKGNTFGCEQGAPTTKTLKGSSIALVLLKIEVDFFVSSSQHSSNGKEVPFELKKSSVIMSSVSSIKIEVAWF